VSPDALLDRLESLLHRFEPAARAERARLLAALDRQAIRQPGALLRFHEALCFLRAYPDGPAGLARVEAALGGFGVRVAALRPRAAAGVAETGLAGTSLYPPLGRVAAAWLASRFPADVELDRGDADLEAVLAALLPPLVAGLPEDALVEVGVDYRAWLDAATRGRRGSALAWLLERVGAAGRPGVGALYDHLQPRLRWALGEGAGSRTRARLPARRVFYHRGPLRPRGGLLDRRLPGPRPALRRAGAAEARRFLDAAMAAVIVRYREVHAFNHADPADVTVADLGRGVELAWFGVRSAARLPLRAHYGYLLVKNGVPVGYGDASLLFDWCEIAFNVFESFRRGESGYLFARLLGFVCHGLGARVFHLAPYQLGRDNQEALASGAFWFYYKLGFRPARPALARLAAGEAARLAAHPGWRSPRRLLARLARGRMVLGVGSPVPPRVATFEARRLALRAAAGAADRAAGLAPYLALVRDLARWPARDRRAVTALVRAKGGAREADYLRRLRRLPRLREAWLALGSEP
jgi:hypothetical protein